MLTMTAILLDGMVYASWVFVVALGLTLIFGVMKILNVAHGAFYAFGAYGAASLIGVYFQSDQPVIGGFAMMIISSVVIGVILGYIFERFLLRPMYGQDEVVLVLVTYATFLILEDVLRLIWGTSAYFAYQPFLAVGNMEVGEMIVSNYDLLLIAFALFTGAASWWALNHSRYGHILTAVIHDREMAASFGVNVVTVFSVTFIIGAVLGALGGAVTAPKISVTPGMGVEVIVLAFAVVAIGGMGSVAGAMIGSVMVGLARASAVHLLPEVELFVIYAVMAAVLAFRPEGLITRVQARKI